jgi:hypothetical protein
MPTEKVVPTLTLEEYGHWISVASYHRHLKYPENPAEQNWIAGQREVDKLMFIESVTIEV